MFNLTNKKRKESFFLCIGDGKKLGQNRGGFFNFLDNLDGGGCKNKT